MKLSETFLVKPGRKVRLSEHEADFTGSFKSKSHAESALVRNISRLMELQYLLYAENKRSVLIILQAMDAGGKDGTIRHVMGALNPQSCRVTSFKEPSVEELKHDFLWRVHKATPARGEIAIFNRSHYEDVLIVRVKDLVAKSVWEKRYDQINAFESLLAENNVMILKFFLHVSKVEQKKRLMQRLEDPKRQWKANPEDFKERRRWDEYMKAYEEALSRCSTKHAPWHIIPSDQKWFRNLAVSEVIVDRLASARMTYPKPAFDISKIKIR